MSYSKYSALTLLLFVAGCGSDNDPAPDLAPTLAAIADQTITANEASNAIAINIDDEVPATVRIAVQSDNDRLLPAASLALGGGGADRTLTVSPVIDELGSGMVTIMATDEEGQTDAINFTVTVVAQQVSLTNFTRETFALDANTSPVLINAVEFIEDTGSDDFADLLQ